MTKRSDDNAPDLAAAVEWLRVTHKGTLTGARIEMVLDALARMTSENERYHSASEFDGSEHG